VSTTSTRISAVAAALAGKHVLVTGASRGIGAAAARALGRAGAALTLLARDRDRVTAVAQEIGGESAGFACDVADYAAVSRCVAAAAGRFGPVDILVNNAGVVEPTARLLDGDPAVWARNVEINLIGAYNVVRAVLPGMVKTGSGRIVNLSSGAAFRPLEGWSAYCAAKAGLAMLTRAIAAEEGGAGILVFGFGPGTTDTDMQGVVRASGINPVSRIPREALTPADVVARAILYLCTPDADDLAGTEVSLGDPGFRRRVGLS
jgi:3-oxoacyl-[acyl-carrier protein] reductase